MNESIERYWKDKLLNTGDNALKMISKVNRDYIGHSSKMNFSFSQNLSDRINSICNKSDLKLFVFFVSSLNIVFFNYLNSLEVLLLSPTIIQESKDNYLNTLLIIKCEIKKNFSFKEFLVEIWKEVSESTKNQNYPVRNVINKYAEEFRAKNYINNIGVLLENIHQKSYLEEISNILFSFKRIESALECEIEFDDNLYDKVMITSLWEYLNNVLNNIFLDFSLDIGKVDLLSNEQHNNFLVCYNNTDKKNEATTIVDLFNKHATLNPNKIAVSDNSKSLTYIQLKEKSDHLALILRKRGVKSNCIVAIYIERSINFIIATLGVLKAGGAYMPIDVNYPQERLNYIINDSAVNIFVVDNMSDHLDSVFHKINIDNIEKYPIIEKLQEVKVTPEDIAYIIYTSGSTGLPKGVVIKHEGFLNYITWAIEQYIRNEDVTFPLFTSVSFDLTITSIFTPLLSGNTIKIYNSEQNTSGLVDAILAENRVEIMKLTPSHLKYMLHLHSYSEKNKLPGLEQNTTKIKRLIVGGEELENELAKSITYILGSQIEIYNEYGPTETVVGSMIYKYSSSHYQDCKSVPIGVPIANTQIYICNKLGGIVAPGVEGEILIGGYGVALGYLNKPDLTDLSFVCNEESDGEVRLYKTGDKAKWIDYKNAIYNGRFDEQIKIRGYRIELGEVESVANSYEGITNCKVIIKNEKTNALINAYIVASFEVDTAKLKRYFATLLPEYMVPNNLFQVNEMPLTINGKLDLNKLILHENEINNNKYVSPTTNTEKIISSIWEEELNIKKISVYDNFFNVGGNSLNMIKINKRLEQKFDRKIEILTLFEYTTVHTLSEFIDNQ